eukprot:1192657-Prorocentrum_minimum.AAC.1
MWAAGLFANQSKKLRGRKGCHSERGILTEQARNQANRENSLESDFQWPRRLPVDGAQAHRNSSTICRIVLPFVQLLSKEDAEEGRKQAEKAKIAIKACGPVRFQDVYTGLRLRYYIWGHGEKVVFLLHGLGENSGVFSGVGARLAGKGYKDLYVQPFAVFGLGLGAAVGLVLAAKFPHLVGALVMSEFSPKSASSLRYFPGQAAQMATTEQAVGFLCSHHW